LNLIPVETPEDFLLAQQFIIPHEETCVSLASLVRRKSDKLVFLVNSENTVIADPEPVEGVETTAEILGLINLDSTIYHCLPDINKIDREALIENLPYLMKKPVRCISGETSGTEFFIGVFEQGNFDKLNHPAQIYPYKMLRWLSLSKPPQTSDLLSGGEEIFRCTEHDMELLHPLQKDYMKDEVAVPGRQLTDAEVDITLRQILKNQLCFSLLCDGEPVAKANTNAIGINCVQIGGVYTHPLYRRNGYAGALVQALCNRATQGGRKPVLFVKEKNTPAFNLYRKLGFEECGRYTIAYY
jgi:GNAT superfamily N-acetyltransferase